MLKAIEQYKITGLAAVPPLWAQLQKLTWSETAKNNIRYFTNTGGSLTAHAVNQLRQLMPKAQPFLMYGLTEAFRSTYLPPQEVDRRIGSIGKAIPNAEILVVKADGSECGVDEVGELVHKGPLVSLGYWNDNEKTKQRFKPAPQHHPAISVPEIAVWSGDYVKKDEQGYLYFVARKDEMIKTSGYRVSPNEVEEILSQSELINEVAIISAPHQEIEQAIIALVSVNETSAITAAKLQQALMVHSQKNLANYMIPKAFITLSQFPKNANGKIDKSLLKQQYQDYFRK